MAWYFILNLLLLEHHFKWSVTCWRFKIPKH